MIYLASPYYHPIPEIMEGRYLAALAYLAYHLRKKLPAFSPIVHCHNIKADMEDWTDNDWLDYDLQILSNCEKLIICQLPKWDLSKGIKREIAFAQSNKITIEHLPSLNIVPSYILDICCG